MHSPLSQTGMKSMLRKKNRIVELGLRMIKVRYRLNVNYPKADYYKCCMIDNLLDKIPAHSPLSTRCTKINLINKSNFLSPHPGSTSSKVVSSLLLDSERQLLQQLSVARIGMEGGGRCYASSHSHSDQTALHIITSHQHDWETQQQPLLLTRETEGGSLCFCSDVTGTE